MCGCLGGGVVVAAEDQLALNLVEIVKTHPSTVDPPCWQRQMEKLQLQE